MSNDKMVMNVEVLDKIYRDKRTALTARLAVAQEQGCRYLMLGELSAIEEVLTHLQSLLEIAKGD